MKSAEIAAGLSVPLEGMLGFELRRTATAVAAALSDALEPLDLRTSEASLLLILAENPGCTQSDVCRALRAQPANMVPIVNRLMGAGLIEREPIEGRAMSLFLTRKGKALHERVKKAMAQHEARIVKRLSKEQQKQVVEALRIICKDACCTDS